MAGHPVHNLALAADLEDNEKAPIVLGSRYVKVSDYGALHVEQHVGRPLKTIAPPDEPGGDTTWTVSDAYDPRAIYCAVIPSTGSTLEDKFARIQLSYPKLDGTNGFDVTEIAVSSGHPLPCPGVKKIKVIAGRVVVFGGYTKPSSSE